MNLPNKLTLLRIILIPVFMVVLYWGFPGATWVALAIFIIASLTAMLWFVEIGQMPAWMLLIVICREFAVSGLRMIASDKGRVIAAGWSGKVKTAATMVCVVLMFLPIPPVVNTLCVWVITLTTLYSGVEYFVKNKDVIASA